VDGASDRTTCDGGNSVTNNNIPFTPNVNQDIGIRVEADPVDYPNSNYVENNLVTGSGLDGIQLFFGSPNDEGSTKNTIVSNTVERNGFLNPPPSRQGDGIRLASPARDPFRNLGANNVLISDNIVRNNAANGIGVNSQHNVVTRNVVSGNGFHAFSLALTGCNGIDVRNDQNEVTNHNQVTNNACDGVALRNRATGNKVDQNTLTGNVLNGIRAELLALSNNIVNNTAIGNGVVPLGYDLREDNPNADPMSPCETNLWNSNDEGTKNQPCVD
jgi:parallel beta-helix repeat protein